MNNASNEVVIRELRPAAAKAGPLVVLIGPMGAGKTTVGQLLADALETEFIDVDGFIEDITAMPIPDIFDTFGEEHFRRVEENAIAHLLSAFAGVLALGGGAVTTPSTRERLRDHVTVLLEVDRDHIGERIGQGEGRPVLAGGDPTEQWDRVSSARRDAFAAVTAWAVDTSGSSALDVATALAHKVRSHCGLPPKSESARELGAGEIARIAVGGGANAYEVVVGRNLLDRIVAAVPDRTNKVMIVHQIPMRERAEVLRGRLQAAGYSAFLAEIPDGEEAKTAQVLAFLWQVLGQADLTRSDLVIGLGGGAATDLAGFAAATWLRGIEVIQVPTTVAGMVDAAVGGKTGINTAEGKNLVGAFYPPRGVIVDLDPLDSLPPFDVAAGLAEVVKCGFIADPEILRLIEADPSASLDVRSSVFEDVLVRAIMVKAEVVSADLTEMGRREILNYGHTFGHAVERAERYQWRHGAAVSVGMVYAAELGFLSGHLDAGIVQRHRNILESLGLPTSYRGDVWAQLHEAMRRDKKARGSMLRFVVLDGIARPTRLEGPPDAMLEAAYAAVAADGADVR